MKKIVYLAFLCLCVLAGCETYPDPSPLAPNVRTGEVVESYRTRAVLSGSYSDVASSAGTVKDCGILLSIVPSMADAEVWKADVNTSGQTFEVHVDGLKAGETYYYQAYAYSGTSRMVGEAKEFSTPLQTVPVLSELTYIKQSRRMYLLSTSIIDEGGSEIQLLGFCWKLKSAGGEPTYKDEHEFVDNEDELSGFRLSGLLANSEYVLRAFASNGTGFGYSNEISFKTDKLGEPIFSSEIFPWGSPEDIEAVVTPEILDSLEEYMPIYYGDTPPFIEGAYLVEPTECVYCQDYATGGGFEPGYIFVSEQIRFFNQDNERLVLDLEGKSVTGSSYKSGTGSFISGSGNNFTVYFDTEGETNGIYNRKAEVYSGTITADGIKDLYHAIVMVEKGDDSNHMLMDEGVFRLFKDGDGMTYFYPWDSGSRSVSPVRYNAVMRFKGVE